MTLVSCVGAFVVPVAYVCDGEGTGLSRASGPGPSFIGGCFSSASGTGAMLHRRGGLTLPEGFVGRVELPFFHWLFNASLFVSFVGWRIMPRLRITAVDAYAQHHCFPLMFLVCLLTRL